MFYFNGPGKAVGLVSLSVSVCLSGQ